MTSFLQLQYIYAHELQIGDSNQRFGQFFVNNYIKESWPDLFYATDHEFASHLIQEWLKKHNYEDELPQPIDRS